MIVRSNLVSVQCFLCDFSCLAIMLSAISALGMESVNGSTQTGEDYSNTTVNSSDLLGKSLICHNNGGVKLVRTWCDMQLTLHAS